VLRPQRAILIVLAVVCLTAAVMLHKLGKTHPAAANPWFFFPLLVVGAICLFAARLTRR
jgi:hypothetical protein